MRTVPLDAPARADSTTGLESTCSASNRALIGIPTPFYANPQQDCAERGFAIFPTEAQINDYRKTANRTSDLVTGVVDSAVSADAPTRVQVSGPAYLITRALDKACTHTPGKKPAVSLLPRILRASRRSGAWVSIDLSSRADSSPVVSMKPLEWQNYTTTPYKWQEGQA